MSNIPMVCGLVGVILHEKLFIWLPKGRLGLYSVCTREDKTKLYYSTHSKYIQIYTYTHICICSVHVVAFRNMGLCALAPQ